MPKFFTYRRPAKVSKQNWNNAPDRKADVSRKAPEQHKAETPQLSPLVIQQLLRKN